MNSVRWHVSRRAGKRALPWVLLIARASKHAPLKNEAKGFDGGKKVSGRKRHIVVDTLGYPMAIDVHSAAPHDSHCAQPVLTGLKEMFPRLVRVLADGGYQGAVQTWFYRHTQGCLLTVVKPETGTKGFQVLQWRWIVERSFAWLGNFRRLSKDYESSTSSAKACIQLAFIKIMGKHIR
ncbi:MAG: IS5 family transposase [Caldilineaceae bacterium]